ncbi:MAG: hypothetical protein GXX00_08290 [Hungateiclostridium thermocellum]|nr:hypothetical protein [Acetivibrio thermocellus]
MEKMHNFFHENIEGRLPSFGEAVLLMVIVSAVLVIFNIFLGISSIAALFLAMLICCAFAAFWGNSWSIIEKMIMNGLKKGLIAMIINLQIGMLIASWCASGTVPYIVSLGLKIISPQWFLVTTCLVCCIMSVSTGSSWTTAGTVGIAMYGVGTVMGIPAGLAASAVLAGSYFGDKLSPISESTNLASAAAETPIMEHVHSMLFVVIPATIVTLIIYAVMGLKYRNAIMDTSNIDIIINGLADRFWLNPIFLIPIIIMGFLIIKKAPAILTMSVAIFMGIALALTQGVNVSEMGDALANGFNAGTGIEVVDTMLSKGGLNAMRNTVYILIFGLPLGGILQGTHTMETIVFKFKGLVANRVSVITGSLITVMVMSAICGDTYAAYIITTAGFGSAHDRLQLDRKVLSRTLEMGVILSCLIPWTSGGTFMSTLFGISPLEYAPFYYWGYLIFIFNTLCAITGFGIFYTKNRRGWGKNKEIPPTLEDYNPLETHVE